MIRPPIQVDVDLRDEDIRVDTYRSSGAGGQHVNTTDSAVRLVHVPTGTIVAIQVSDTLFLPRTIGKMSLVRVSL